MHIVVCLHARVVWCVCVCVGGGGGGEGAFMFLVAGVQNSIYNQQVEYF